MEMISPCAVLCITTQLGMHKLRRKRTNTKIEAPEDMTRRGTVYSHATRQAWTKNRKDWCNYGGSTEVEGTQSNS